MGNKVTTAFETSFDDGELYSRGFVVTQGLIYTVGQPCEVVPYDICRGLIPETLTAELLSPFYFTKSRVKTWQHEDFDSAIGSWIASIISEHIVRAVYKDGVTKQTTTIELSSSHVFSKGLIHLDLRHQWFNQMVSELDSSDDMEKKKLCCYLIIELLRTPVASVFVQKRLKDGSKLAIVLRAIADTIECPKTRMWMLHMLVCGAGNGHNTKVIRDMTAMLLENTKKGMAAQAAENAVNFPCFAYHQYINVVQKSGSENDAKLRRLNRLVSRCSMYSGAIFFSLMV